MADVALFRRLRRRRRPPAAERCDRVAPWLILGPALTAGGYERLRSEGVTHVVDLRAESYDDPGTMSVLGLTWRHLPTGDRSPPTDGAFDRLVRWLDGECGPDTGRTLYLHCEGGIGRTPTVAMALLMEHGYSLRQARSIVSNARPEVAPTAAQLEWLDRRAAQRASPFHAREM